MRRITLSARLKLTLRRFLSPTVPPLQPAFTTRAALQPDLLHFPPLPLNCHAEAVTLCVCVFACARECVAAIACRLIVFRSMLKA